MTDQITVKLNKERFKPLFNWLDAYGRHTFTSCSDIAAKCIFFVYLLMNEKRDDLDGLTRIEFIDKKRDISLDEGYLEFLKVYNEFVKKGVIPKGCDEKDF